MESDQSVLIVEDEPLIRDLCADVFKQAGYRVVEAETGDAALEILNSGENVAAVVSDIRMPGAIDGLALRAVVGQRWPTIKFLLTSGHRLEKPESLQDRDVFLPKPYRFLRLVEEVNLLLAA
jgi:DNA-binding NtrC family response regulator